MATDVTGRCSRCGAPATHTWTSRDAMAPIELCDPHTEEHADAIKRGSWVEV